jgi:hypothetical protein
MGVAAEAEEFGRCKARRETVEGGNITFTNRKRRFDFNQSMGHAGAFDDNVNLGIILGAQIVSVRKTNQTVISNGCERSVVLCLRHQQEV